MPLNAKEIRRRIKGVKSTQQITKAMEMVAAAKVRRAHGRVTAARPYAQAIQDVFAAVTASLPKGEIESALLERRAVRKVAIVVVTSDKGLAGAYNANILRAAVGRIREWQQKDAEVSLVLVGNKAVTFFRHWTLPVLSRYTSLPAIPTFTESKMIVEEVTQLYRERQVDHVDFMFTRFHTMLRYTPETDPILPARLPEGRGEGFHAETIFEPSAQEMIEQLIPRYLETVIFQGLLESTASELASRMAAMGAASKNAGEMIGHLTLVLNKARQGAITQEILEVVGGAEALKA